MTAVFQVLPLGVLLIGAVWMVWRGMAREPDGSKNKRHYDVGGS